ncbi:SufE family protein [bacterium]|nr:SufE family protein [bacterium]
MPFPPKIEQLLEDLSYFEDRMERFQALIEFADRFVDVPERIARRPFSESHRAPRCDSEAYVWTEPLDDGKFKYHFAVENPQGISAKAMAVILDECLSGDDPQQATELSHDVVFAIFGKEISMGKGQGLMGMVDLVRMQTRRLAAIQS